MKLLLDDPQGTPSWEITLSVVLSVLITGKFLVGGFAITFAKWSMTIAALSGSDYAIAVAPWVALFMGHRYIGARWGGNGGDGK